MLALRSSLSHLSLKAFPDFDAIQSDRFQSAAPLSTKGDWTSVVVFKSVALSSELQGRFKNCERTLDQLGEQKLCRCFMAFIMSKSSFVEVYSSFQLSDLLSILSDALLIPLYVLLDFCCMAFIATDPSPQQVDYSYKIISCISRGNIGERDVNQRQEESRKKSLVPGDLWL